MAGQVKQTANGISLCVSAHWYVAGARVSAEERPRTIHDFGGFPRDLFQVQYPAPGSPRLAARVRDLLASTPVEMDTRWGPDHGSWSGGQPLHPIYPYPFSRVPMPPQG
jgi:4,5-DOPA dioxygenase extradiol